MADNNEKTVTLSLNKNVLTGFLVVLLLGAAFAIGSLWTKVQTMENSNNGGVANNVLPTNPGGAPQPQPVDIEGIRDTDYIRGNPDAKFALIEYSDFECPFCQRFHPTAQQVVDEYDGEVMWVFRHFPLTQIHPKAQKYAEATECAAEQGGNDAFWAMGDAIFDQAPAVSQLGDLANELGLNQGNFEECLDSDRMADRVTEVAATGAEAGVTGTPGNILLNIETGEAQLISGAVPFSTLKGAIDSMMNN